MLPGFGSLLGMCREHQTRVLDKVALVWDHRSPAVLWCHSADALGKVPSPGGTKSLRPIWRSRKLVLVCSDFEQMPFSFGVSVSAPDKLRKE